jgi:hypothetical protein
MKVVMDPNGSKFSLIAQNEKDRAFISLFDGAYQNANGDIKLSTIGEEVATFEAGG